MKKALLKYLALGTVALLPLAGSASASKLPDLTGNYVWNSSDYWSATDLSNGQATFELQWENANAAYESSLGLYSISSGLIETFELFSATDEPNQFPGLPQTASAWFRLENGIWQISDAENGIYKDFGNTFGFYSDIYTGGVNDTTKDYTWYTDMSLNVDGAEHFAMAYDSVNHNTVLIMEDRFGGLPSGGDDPYDIMITSSDLDPSPVPEPATMFLFGTGLFGLATGSRLRKKRK